ncbi:MAG TPA: S41 family peptidase [Chiayiivirga sp.]|nr:S41 family peptidase [Chiayiivirga sp.]
MRILAILLGFGLAAAATAQSPGYFRYPAIGPEQLVFTSEGDLWSVPIAGGQAYRLTTHAAEESRAALSPDGQRVAFTASYAGAEEAYVMPTAGGTPKRVSFDNGRALVVGWSAQGEVLYGTVAAGGTGGSQRVIAAVNPDTLQRRILPVAEANDAVISADGKTLYFVRYGLGVTNDNARGYRGGAVSQLWRFDLSSDAEAVRIGPRDVNLRRPMLAGDRLLVIADPAGRDVLAQLDPGSGALTALAVAQDFDVRSASASGQRVVYQSGADLRVFDLASGQDRAVSIQLSSDFAQRQARWLEKHLRYAQGSDLSDDGERAVVVARGHAVIAGVGASRRVDLGVADGVRVANATFSHDRESIYAISDASGEEEIWRYAADGSNAARQLTHDGVTQRNGLVVSPDGKSLAHTDKRGRLWLLDLASGTNTVIDDGGPAGSQEYANVEWSPDSRYIALVRVTGRDGRNRLGLYSLDRKQVTWLTSDKYASANPAFSPDGQWLWFLSDREFKLVNGSPWGDRNTGPYFDKRTRIYGLALQPTARFPFQAKDELQPRKNDSAGNEDDKSVAAGKPKALVLDGLAERLYEVPVAAGNYSALQVDGQRLYFLDGAGWGAKTLRTLAFDDSKTKIETFAENVSDYALARNAKKLMMQVGAQWPDNPGKLHIVDSGAKAPTDLSDTQVQLEGWRLRVDPVAEWQQMFNDAWRMHRDHFYDANLRGVDWVATRQHYAPLLARVSDRLELDDLLAQMMGELGALHSQVRGGEFRKADEVPAYAGLGATWSRTADGWSIDRIYRTEAELPSQRGPLQASQIDVREGDVIVAVNGRKAVEAADLSELLANTSGRQVLLETLRAGKHQKQIVVPVDAMREDALRYADWLESRRAAVAKAGQGKIGYLHLRAMGPNDIASFVRDFYANIERDGLVIDVRRNRGGNIDSWVIEKLLRRTWMFWQPPGGLPYGNMQQSFRGHLVVLTDALTYSDGETFSAGIQTLKLAPLIGTRTAGAGVWLSDGNALVDGGRARVAEYPQFGLDGRWLIEAVGVSPDVEVDNLPHESFKGVDRQLDTAIDWLQRKLDAEPVKPLRAGVIPALPPRP